MPSSAQAPHCSHPLPAREHSLRRPTCGHPPRAAPGPPRPHRPAHHVFELGQPALPAVIEKAEHDDDHAEGADDHQHHKERPVVAAHLAGPGLAAAGGGVVPDANLGVGEGPGSLAGALGCRAPPGPIGLGLRDGRGPCLSPPPSRRAPDSSSRPAVALTQLWLMSGPTPTWGCPIPRGRHELAVTDHTAPPTWVQTGQLGACALSPLHTCPTRLQKLSSHLRVGDRKSVV